MAFDFLKNLFGSKSDKAKLTHIKTLVATAMADGKIDHTEKALLAMVVKREGITEKEFMEALNGKKVEYTIPEDMATRERYLRDLAALMVVDGTISPDEMKICILAAQSFGFSQDQATEIISTVAATAVASGYDGDKLMRKAQEEAEASNADIHNVKQADTAVKNEPRKEEKTERDPFAPDLATTNSVVWMAHCINHDIFVPRHENMAINASIASLLNDFGKAVKTGDGETTNRIYNDIQGMMMKKLGNQINNPMTKALMLDFKMCALSKDLLDLYKMVIEGQKDEDVLSGKGSIRRILKYSIELGSPVKTLDALTDYFVNNEWFDNMPEEIEWHKLALECMMVTGNGELGNKILGIIQKDGGISEDEKEELLEHARGSRSQTDTSWM